MFGRTWRKRILALKRFDLVRELKALRRIANLLQTHGICSSARLVSRLSPIWLISVSVDHPLTGNLKFSLPHQNFLVLCFVRVLFSAVP